MAYTKRMFASKFGSLSKNDLISLDNGSILIEDDKDLQEFKNAGIGITSDRIYIIKTKSFGRTALKRTIEIQDINSRSIEIDSARNFDKENKVAGISVIAGQGPFTSMKFENTILQFSTGDESFVLELPQSQKLKKKFESLSKSSLKGNEEDQEAVEILEKRFAKGEISEEEFKSKKELLQND